jgi:hypothetical protein
MTPEGFNGHSQADWYKAFYEAAAQAGVGGATYWIFTPDPRRGYSISYSTDRDAAVRAELRRAAELFASLEGATPTARLLESSHHLIPRQFIFSRDANDPAAVPELIGARTAEERLKFLFKPEMAVRGRFEKLGGGAGYVWGSGVGFFEYVVPARAKGRWVKSVVVRAHVQPVLPQDARPPVTATRVTLYINGKDCGSRVVPVETPQRAIVEEWNVSSIVVRAQASRGLPLTVRFAITVDADQPYGLNISNFSEGHGRPDQRPIEVEIR